MQWCTANAFPCCLSATTIQKRVSLSGQQPIRLVHLFVSCDTVAFHHCVLGNLGCGCFCWALPRSLFDCLHFAILQKDAKGPICK